jgi:hypothetical protein
MYSHVAEQICSYIHVFTAGFARTYMYSHVLLVHTCIHIQIHTCIHMYIHVFTCIHMYSHVLLVHTCIHIHVNTCEYMYCSYIHVFTYM